MIESVYWMDGYGPYVWAAWLVAGIGLMGLLVRVVVNDNRSELTSIKL